ncbi:MAG: hypothetical protein AAGI66_00880 [Cyanobacteria bacterium P01_H01_bin.74]
MAFAYDNNPSGALDALYLMTEHLLTQLNTETKHLDIPAISQQILQRDTLLGQIMASQVLIQIDDPGTHHSLEAVLQQIQQLDTNIQAKLVAHCSQLDKQLKGFKTSSQLLQKYKMMPQKTNRSRSTTA